MHLAVTALAVLSDPTSTPSPTPTLDPNLVTPGVWGFVVIGLVTLAVIALIFDMMRRIRRGRYRADVRAELDAEAEAQRPGDAPVEASDVGEKDPGPDDRRGP